MDQQTPTAEGAAVPTPPAGMSPNDSALEADQQPKVAEAKPAELKFIEETLGREFPSLEEARNSLKNLNSLVGDQTVSKQRKAIEKMAQQANLSPDELVEVIESQDLTSTETPSEVVSQPVRSLPDDSTKRLVRLETNDFVKTVPEAEAIKDMIFAEALQSGKPVEEIWNTKYVKVMEAGKKQGAKKLQTTLEGQPTRATSTASDADDTKVDFKGMSSKDMEKFMGYTPPKVGI